MTQLGMPPCLSCGRSLSVKLVKLHGVGWYCVYCAHKATTV